MKSLALYILIGTAASLYAMVLNTKPGRRFNEDYTWATVSIGTAIVLLFLKFLIPGESWRKMAIAFAVSGTPMITRSLYNRMLR